MTRSELIRLLARQTAKYYVYVLSDPDGRPFYVGQGQGNRLLAHEEEARDSRVVTAKCERIRQILATGGSIDYQIDSWHENAPWNREGELILELERVYPLTNAQRYAPAAEVDGVVLRKYANAYEDNDDLRAIPPGFPYLHTRLMAGPKRPGRMAKVYGRIYAILEQYPGITGGELVVRLHEIDWSDVKSAYTEGRSIVSGKWLSDYVTGGFYKKNRFITFFQE